MLWDQDDAQAFRFVSEHWIWHEHWLRIENHFKSNLMWLAGFYLLIFLLASIHPEYSHPL